MANNQHSEPLRTDAASGPDEDSDRGYEVLPADEPGAEAPPGPGYAVLETEPVPAPAARPRAARRKLLRVAAGLAVALVVLGTGFVVYDRTLRADSSSSSASSAEYERARQRAANRRTAPADAQRPALDDPVPPLAPARPPAVQEQRATTGLAAEATGPAAESSVEIGIAYGTENRRWLEWATTQFVAADEGRGIRVHLIPMGSLESAHAILDGDQRIHVWAPASSLYRESLLRDWEAKHEGHLIRKEEPLALTPLVLVMWKKRYEAFAARCPDVSLRTIGYAMHAAGGWQRIAGKPEWGRFKFGHTHPNQSNSGLMTLIVMAYESCEKSAGLTVADIMSANFQDYLTRLGTGVTGLSNSTGNMMKEMILEGPSSYDVLMVYESVALEYLESAAGCWDQLRVIYPRHNLWNDHPYCILDTPWTTSEHQQAAEKFLKFLLSEPVQLRGLEEHGFRPGNPSVPVNGPRSPLVRFADSGVQLEIPDVCEVPSREVIENLQQAWLRCAAPRGTGQR